MTEGQVTGESQGGTQPGSEPKAGDAPKTYTQEDFDSAAAAIRKAEAKRFEKAQAKWREEHGLTDEAIAKIKGGGNDDLSKKYDLAVKELELYKERTTKAERRANEQGAMGEIHRLASSLGANAEGLELVWDHLRARGAIGFDDDGSPVCLDANGNATNKTLKQVVQEFFAKRPALVAAPAPTGGAGSRPSGDRAPAEPDLLTPAGRRAAMIAGGFGARK